MAKKVRSKVEKVEKVEDKGIKTAEAGPIRSKLKSLSEKVKDRATGTGTADTAGKVNVAEPHLMVEALAGTGKTTTLVCGVVYMFRHSMPGVWAEMIQRKFNGKELIPSPQQQIVWDQMSLSANWAKTIRFAAYNKKIVVNFERDWSWLVELLRGNGIFLSFSTMHSLGYAAVKKAFGYKKPNGWHTANTVSDLMGMETRQIHKDHSGLLPAVEQTVSLMKANLCDWRASDATSQMSQIINYYGVDLENHERRVFELVPEVMERHSKPDTAREISFDDMVWLPCVHNLPVEKVDLFLGDEVQDWTRAQQQLAKKSGQRIILCGDKNQSIYGFTGADPQAIPRQIEDLTKTDRGVLCLPLTVTRRCGKAFVKRCQTWVKEFEAFETSPEGTWGDGKFPVQRGTNGDPVKLEYDKTFLPQTRGKDVVLSRTNGPLAMCALMCLRNGKRAAILGRDILAGIQSTIKKCLPESVPPEQEIPVFRDNLLNWSANEVTKEQQKRNPSEAKMIMISERTEVILAFLDDSSSLVEMNQKLDRLFTDDDSQDVVLFSTVHKFKGSEADRVFIINNRFSPMPHPMAKKPWQISQETNLMYVAYSRAKFEIVEVS